MAEEQTSITAEEARELTKRIKKNTEQFARLLKQAWEKKVWLPLGYSSFADWLASEIGVSRSRGYQLVAIAQLEETIKEAVPLPDSFIVTDLQTRFIMSFGVGEVVDALKRESTDDPNENLVMFHRVVKELQAEAKETSSRSDSTTPPNVVDISTKQVGGGVRDAQTIRLQVKTFSNVADTIPHPSSVDDPEVLVEVYETLQNTTKYLVARVEEYEEAVKALPEVEVVLAQEK